MANDVSVAREEIVAAGLKLLREALTVGSWGNLSVRVGEVVAITPSGWSYEKMTPEDIVLVNMLGEKVAGERTPSTELPLHLAVYRVRGDVNAIVHTHSMYASCVAAMQRTIPPLLEDSLSVAGGDIPCAKYALAGSEQLAENVVTALGTGYGALMANHGALCCGRTLEEALTKAEVLEKVAQVYCITESLGGGVPIAPEYVSALTQFMREHYSKRQLGLER